jgi:mannose-6-phosphate isomerase-like protein (cupin superfamily)
MSIERIAESGEILAIIVRREHSEPGVHFLTPSSFSQQLGCMQHPAGKTIQPHVHNRARREVAYTQEVLFIKSGRLRVDFYGDNRKYLESRVLEAGDVILLASAGHGFEVLEAVQMVEVKQGPYDEHEDKTRFQGVSSDQVVLKGSET